MRKKLAWMMVFTFTVAWALTGCSSGGGSQDKASTAAETEGSSEAGMESQTAAQTEGTSGAGTVSGTDAASGTASAAQLDEDAVYAVEAGSAGEEVAKEKGLQCTSVASQADALMEVNAGTSDAAIIDLLMAGAMIGEGTSYPNLVYTEELTSEEYGVGCRKGSDLASYINAVFGESYADGSMLETAKEYGVQESLLEQEETEYIASPEDSDVDGIRKKGTLVVGITDFAPMDYQDASGEWIGFDADMARKVAEKLGVEIEFVVIDWDTKNMELDSGNIDVVWNGMTLTEDVKAAMECTNPYCKNAQVIVVPSN